MLLDNLIGLKSIGKAGKAVSKQIGKTLTAIGESPDQRGLQKVSKAQNPRYSSLVRRQNRDVKKDEGIFVPGADSGKFHLYFDLFICLVSHFV